MKKIIVIFVCLLVAVAAFIFNSTKVKAPFTEKEVKDEGRAPAYEVGTEKSTTFTFAGDMMFDRYVNHIFKNAGFPHIFDNLDKSLFLDKDISFANLEGPVSDKPIVDDYPERSLIFNMPPETINTIKNLGINGVSLANNHTLNAGSDGFTTTRDLLKNAGIKYAGYQNSFDQGSIIRYQSEIAVSIITVDYLSFTNNTKIDEAIKTEKNAGQFVIIFPHWGEEYAPAHNTVQENAAKSWIDSGADLVIGSHPHVIQDVGVYKNKPIIYSLGNFVFDQTFSSETQQGLVISGKITETALEINFLPVQSVNLKPELMKDNKKTKILSQVLSNADLSESAINGDSILLPR